jgi:hypothetical protein
LCLSVEKSLGQRHDYVGNILDEYEYY